MKLKFIDPSTLDKNLKATVHKTGKMGFSMEAASKLGLGEFKSARIAINEADPEDKSLYMVIEDSIVERAFKINRAGKYFYINTKALFDGMQMDYVKNSYVYDIAPTNVDGQTVYRFKRRPVKKSKISPPNDESGG